MEVLRNAPEKGDMNAPDAASCAEIIDKALRLAKAKGAAAEATIATGSGLSVSARLGEVETIERQRDQGLTLTAYIGRRKGVACSSDFSAAALEDTVAAACTIAGQAGEDDCAGLIEPEHLAAELPDLDLYHPWALDAERAIALAVECEGIARAQDARISNSDGATVSSYSGSHRYGNTHGFRGGWDWSSHSMDCSMIAEQDGLMQRDGWYTKARDRQALEDIHRVGEQAAQRTLARLGARRLSTRQAPVIYEAPVAAGLFAALLGAISGRALYRKASFLLDKLGARIFPEYMQIYERPHLKKAHGSAAFDNDGMATFDKHFVRDGVLASYALSAYSARKLRMTPTGNAGGVHNLMVQPGDKDLPGLIKDMRRGLLITDLIGFGVNQVTGDYSRGAAGFWVEHGEIQYPVEEITVAANLADMFQQISAVGRDVDRRGNIQTGSVLIENMTIAGN